MGIASWNAVCLASVSAVGGGSWQHFGMPFVIGATVLIAAAPSRGSAGIADYLPIALRVT